MNIDFFPLITSLFVAKDDSVVRFQLFDKNVPDVEDRYATTSPGMGAYYRWFHADWRMPADEPIVIEWSGDKKATIIGSTCTVTLVSPYDGALQELYTTDARQYCCLISRKAVGADSFSPVWFGWLDPEFYEEPFIAKKDYEVTLTFSDFGPLKRLVAQRPFAQADGRFTIQQIVHCAIAQIDPSVGSYSTEDSPRTTQYVSTTLADGTLLADNNNNGGNNRTEYTSEAGATKVLTGLQVRFDNFTDEDGETMTWYDVLEAVLRPLALRIEQRAGHYYVYDINALFIRSKLFDAIVYDGSALHDTSVYPYKWWDAEDYQDYPEVMPGETAPDGWAVELTHDSPRVDWASTDQMLAVDETFNNVKITFSPYAETTLFDGEKSSFTINETFMPIKNGYGYGAEDEYESFLLRIGAWGAAVDGITIEEHTTPFEIESLQSGSDCRGVIAFLGDITYNHETHRKELVEHESFAGDNNHNTNLNETQFIGRIPTAPTSASEASALYTVRRIWIPNAYGNAKLGGRNQVLKIQIPLLYSEKYNPWEQSDNSHNVEYTSSFREKFNSVMLQLRLRLYAGQSGGNPLFYYQNYGWGERGSIEDVPFRMGREQAGWKAYNTQSLPTLIHYCKFDGTKVDSKKISTGDGMADGGEPFNNANETTYYFRENFDGIYVPLPLIKPTDSNYKAGYWLELEVTDGLYLYDQGNMFNDNAGESSFAKYCSGPINSVSGSTAYADSRWWLVGFPTIKLVQNNRQIYGDIDVEDIEQSGVIDANAAEELSIDTICGNIDMPVAKGAYIKATTNQPAITLRRGARSDSVEQLLIGTIYSQYAGRHLKLNGSAKTVLPLQGLSLLTDTHYPGKRFLVVQETYNISECESEITMVEASPDSYTSE